MVEAHHGRAREPGAVPRAGVGEPVRQDQVVLAHECRDHAQIRQVAAAEDQGALGPLQLGELLFQLGIQRMAAGHQSRCARAGAVAFERLARRRDHARMVRQPEVVVATERDILLAATANPRAAEPLGFLERPGQRLPRRQLELLRGRRRRAPAWVDFLPRNASIAPIPRQCRGDEHGFQRAKRAVASEQRPACRHDWTQDEVLALYRLPFNDLIFQAQTVHRAHFDANEVQISTLLSIKTGGCPEDCAYCPQSAHFDTGLKSQKLMAKEAVLAEAERAQDRPARRGFAWERRGARPRTARSSRSPSSSPV